MADTIDTEALDRVEMERLANGHDAALNQLMDRHAERVFQFLFRMLGSEDDAHDLAQETFLRVYQARASYNPGQKFTSWLYTIAANLARNQLRWRSRHPNVSLETPSNPEGSPLNDTLPDGVATPGDQLEATERTSAVLAAVQALPEDLREALVLCEWEERSMAEAAEILNTTAKAIESRLYRARQQLRERLKRWVE
jgi:RNA polymerase sigma-70 factor (ECF subfamily)